MKFNTAVLTPCYITAVKMTFKLHAPRTAVEDYRLLYSISDVWKKGGKERDKTNSREQAVRFFRIVDDQYFRVLDKYAPKSFNL